MQASGGGKGELGSIGVLHPTFEDWGGAEWFIHQLLQAFVRGGATPPVVYTHRWRDPPGDRPLYTVITHRLGGTYTGPWDWERIARRLLAAWRSHDVLFVHNFPALQWYRHAAARGVMPPALWYCHEPPVLLHGPVPEPPVVRAVPRVTWASIDRLRFYKASAAWRLWSRARQRLAILTRGAEGWREDLRRRDREAVAGAAMVVSNSNFTAGRVKEIYSRGSRVVYPLPADLDSISPGGEKEDLVLWVGRMTAAKRPEVMIAAWHRACEMEPRLRGFRLALVGSGPLREHVAETTDRLGMLGAVVLVRDLTRPELIDLYRRALLTVHLSKAEPFGLVPVESMAAGTPVLVEGRGGVLESVVDGRTGWCIEGLDEPRLAERLARLPDERESLVRMGLAAARHVAERFVPRESHKQIVECLRELAGSEGQAETAIAGTPPLRSSPGST